jgi:hypothetical protein
MTVEYTLDDILSTDQLHFYWKVIHIKGFAIQHSCSRILAYDKMKRNKAAKIMIFGTEDQKRNFRIEKGLSILRNQKKSGGPKKRTRPISLAKVR